MSKDPVSLNADERSENLEGAEKKGVTGADGIGAADRNVSGTEVGAARDQITNQHTGSAGGKGTCEIVADDGTTASRATKLTEKDIAQRRRLRQSISLDELKERGAKGDIWARQFVSDLEKINQMADGEAKTRLLERFQDSANKMYQRGKYADGVKSDSQSGYESDSNEKDGSDDAAHQRSYPEILVASGVDRDYAKRVRDWWSVVPEHIRKLAVHAHTTIRVVNHINDDPRLLAAAREHARGHAEETVAHLPMFYSPQTNALVFASKPALTRSEQAEKDKVDAYANHQSLRGVQSFGKSDPHAYDPKSRNFAALERNGWHELGHALEQMVLSRMAARSDFKNAFDEAVKKIPAEEKKALDYFVRSETGMPRGHEHDGARQELFAEIFAIRHIPDDQRTGRDRLILKRFEAVIKIMAADKHNLFG